jgi:hypothetical protein
MSYNYHKKKIANVARILSGDTADALLELVHYDIYVNR